MFPCSDWAVKAQVQKYSKPMKSPLLPLAAVFLMCQACISQETSSEGGSWSTLSIDGNPAARHETAMVAFDGKAYLFGGRGIKPVEEFDPATATWRQLGPTPLEIHHFQGNLDLAEAVEKAAKSSRPGLPANHGPLAAGKSLDGAVYATEELSDLHMLESRSSARAPDRVGAWNWRLL